jgi:hypothetical protein
MSRDSLTIVLAVAGVVLVAAAGSALTDRMRAPSVPRPGAIAASAGERSVTLEVAGMTCSGCAVRVADELKGTPGVVACSMDARAGRAVVVCTKEK